MNIDVGFHFMHCGHPVGCMPGTYKGTGRDLSTFFLPFFLLAWGYLIVFHCSSRILSERSARFVVCILVINFVSFQFLKVTISLYFVAFTLL